LQSAEFGDRQPRSITRHALTEVVEARYEEIYSLILDELRRSGYAERIPAGIVITGGTSLMEGAAELAEKVFQMPVRYLYQIVLKECLTLSITLYIQQVLIIGLW